MYYMQGLQSFEAVAIWVVFGIAIVGLLYALLLRSQIMGEDKGTKEMQDVWNAIKDGADAYLSKQFKSILPLIGVLTIALFLSVYVVPPSPGSPGTLSWHGRQPDQIDHRNCARPGLYHGCGFLPHRWPAWHAHGH